MKDPTKLAPAWWDIGICPITGFKIKSSFREKSHKEKDREEDFKWPKV